MKLSGENIMLRPIQSSDFPKMIDWTNHQEIRDFCEGNYPQSLAQCQEWHQRSQSNRYQERFAIVFHDQVIGDIELDQITWRSGDAELRIRIGEQGLWDQGLGTDAVKCLLTHAFFHMNLNRVYLKVYVDNLRAIRCYQKVGFKKEGRLRRNSSTTRFREIFLMRIFKNEFARRHHSLQTAG